MSRRRTVDIIKSQNDSRLYKTTRRLSISEVDGSEFSTAQFYQQPEEKIPWKTLFFVSVFFCMGVICLTLGLLISFGLMDEKYHDRSLSLSILGTIMLIPGAYYMYILLSIYMKREGYGLHLVPSL